MSDAQKTPVVGDDQDEILRVADQLSSMKLHGAAQMICRLARQRDGARTKMSIAAAILAL